LEDTIQYIGDSHFIIADAKRGDIGNTASMYAKAILDLLGCDAITVNPYMGKDTVTPFFRPGKFVILLAHTSNSGSQDFQRLPIFNSGMLYETVMKTSTSWGGPE